MATLKSSESEGSYCFIHGQKTCKGDSSGPDLVPDAKWWLNHHGPENAYSFDQLNMLETDTKNFAAIYVNGNAKAPAGNKPIEDYCTIDPKNGAAFCSDAPFKQFYSRCKNNGDSWLLDFESTVSDDFLCNSQLMGLNSCKCLLFDHPEKLCSDLDSHWIGVKKIEPWWHAVDKDDLASLVTETSSHSNRNCSHPGVLSMHIEKVSENCVCCFDQFKEQISKETNVSHLDGCIQENLASVGKDKSLGKEGLMEYILQESNQTFSKGSCITAEMDSFSTQEPSADLSRAQLIEALCHSQTRAREAENLAQKACDEKDHIVNLFFQQALRLFAYRQWLRVLQLETLCLHLSSKNQFSSFPTPSRLPWAPNKGMTLRNNKCRAGKKKLGKQRCNVSKCAVAFAIGLGLAGAGLLVGWTIGWLFPPF